MKIFYLCFTSVVLLSAMSFAQLQIKFEQYQLGNGMNVILHEDHSAPVVATVVMYHVGSKNEKVKRTGFAHLFEHMMFQGSEHVGDDEHFKILSEVGASINGFTTEDGTTYFEVVPSNQLELSLYLESDRMGFLLPAMTQEKLDNQRDVVKNERRQRVDNVPYGTADEKIAKAMFPSDHPYSWPVIGFMEDLSAAAMDDVKDFFRTYYAPNNACLVLSGDCNSAEAKQMIEKYFGSFPEGTSFDRPEAVPVSMKEETIEIFEDKVQLPRLYMTWHSPKSETREDAVMTVFARILSSGKNSRLFKELVYEKQIAQSAFAFQGGSEIAGQFQIQVTAKPGKTLTEMHSAVTNIINEILQGGVEEKEIEKAITGIESQIINSATTVLGKATALASYYSYTGDPNNINKQMDDYKGITSDELVAVAMKYFDKPNMVLSIVPVGKTELAVTRGE
ncbi:MAG: insulinase family protein [Ignavibacteriae bacterium]|nr:insulinase family protein [Ignavibacteriota bacterium]